MISLDEFKLSGFAEIKSNCLLCRAKVKLIDCLLS